MQRPANEPATRAQSIFCSVHGETVLSPQRNRMWNLLTAFMEGSTRIFAAFSLGRQLTDAERLAQKMNRRLMKRTGGQDWWSFQKEVVADP